MNRGNTKLGFYRTFGRYLIAAVGWSGVGAGMAQEPARIYLSVDQGKSWKAADAGFPREGTVNDFAGWKDVLFAGTQADGIFISRDEGKNWTWAGAGLPKEVKVDALAATEGVVFAGTHGDGIYISKDGGGNWRPSNTGLANLTVRRLYVAGELVFAGTNGGVFVSADDGEEWRHLTGEGQINGISMLKDVIYVAEIGSIRSSADMGRRWRSVLTTDTPHNIWNDGGSLFAMLYSEGVKKSSDGGMSWSEAQLGLPAKYTFQILAVKGGLLAAQWDGVYASEDGGGSWTLSNAGMAKKQPITELFQAGNGRILAGAGLRR